MRGILCKRESSLEICQLDLEEKWGPPRFRDARSGVPIPFSSKGTDSAISENVGVVIADSRTSL